MADVTISGLQKQNTQPTDVLPFSTGANTYACAVTSLFANTDKIGIGHNNPAAYNNTLSIKGKDSTTFTGTQPLGLGVLNGGNYDLAGIDFKNLAGNSLAGRIGVSVTGGGGYLLFGTSNNYATGITNTALTIDPNGNVGVGIGVANAAAKLDVNGSIFTKGYNHIECAQFGPTQASINNILANEAGYFNFDTTTNTDNAMFNSNTSVFELAGTGNYGIKILKTGYLNINYFQDVITAAKAGFFTTTQNYVAMLVGVNGITKARHLISHTNGIWDGLMGTCTLKVNANDIVTFYIYCATPASIKISQLDAVLWSNYNFMFWS